VDQEKIERALDACYDAIVAPETWPDALHALARSVDAVGCRFRGRNVPPTRELPMSPGVCEFAAEFVRDGWWRNDHRAQRAWPRFVSGTRVLLDEPSLGLPAVVLAVQRSARWILL
jgi:hypothetical protein